MYWTPNITILFCFANGNGRFFVYQYYLKFGLSQIIYVKWKPSIQSWRNKIGKDSRSLPTIINRIGNIDWIIMGKYTRDKFVVPNLWALKHIVYALPFWILTRVFRCVINYCFMVPIIMKFHFNIKRYTRDGVP